MKINHKENKTSSKKSKIKTSGQSTKVKFNKWTSNDAYQNVIQLQAMKILELVKDNYDRDEKCKSESITISITVYLV